MIKTAIFGAGQAGRMVRRWLPASHELIGYIDNNKDKQGGMTDGVPVMSMEKALELGPDRIWIATLNTEAAASIEKQLRDAGYKGTLRYANAFRDAQDIRLAGLRLIAGELSRKEHAGAIAELGVYKGEFAAEMNRLFPDRELYLFDTFAGFADEDLRKEEEITGGAKVWHPDFTDTCIEDVRARLPHPEKAHFVKGYFPESASQLSGDDMYLFVNIDPDLYEPTKQGLEYFWPRLVQGGVIMVHDYNSMQFQGVKKAVWEFADQNGLMPVPLADLHGTAVFVKQI